MNLLLRDICFEVEQVVVQVVVPLKHKGEVSGTRGI